MVCYMLICGLSYRQSYHSFPRGMGIEFTHLQSPTEPACGLPHHRAAYQDGVPRSDYLQPDGAGPTVPFYLQQRLVWFGFQVRVWSGLQIPYSILFLTTFLFSLFCISHFLGFILLHLWWLKSVRKKELKQNLEVIRRNHPESCIQGCFYTGRSWKDTQKVAKQPQPPPGAPSIATHKGLHCCHPIRSGRGGEWLLSLLPMW